MMRLKTKVPFFKTIAVSLGVAVLALFWQNCSRVSLAPAPITQLSISPSLKLNATICPQSVTEPGGPTAFLFILDMSTSNIGAPLVQGPYSYWDPTKATDLNGARFDAVEYFLNSCANSTNARFAIVGFSEGVGQLTGSGSRTKWVSNCNSKAFGTASQATSVIEGFRNEQNVESQWYDQWSLATNNYLTTTDFPPIMKGTNYLTALQCADQIIDSDLTSSASVSQEQYQVIFITDGAPNDPTCTQSGMSAADSQSCYSQYINSYVSDMRESALSEAKDLRLSTVFYGDADGDNTVPTVLSTMSQDGGTPAPMQLATFQNQQQALCSLVNSELSIGFLPNSFFAVNLTTLNKADQQKPDSDMDGIPDDEETALGYDPLDPRSRVDGVLDGVCERVGGLDKCRQLRSQLTCDDHATDNYLSDCDLKILKLDQLTQNPTVGLDSDGDGIPDFLELIKGLDPSAADALSDPDGDGITNQKEIMQDSDPFTPDADLSPSLMNVASVTFNPQLSECNGGGWTMDLSQTSVSPTQAVTFKDPNLQDLSHGDTDQVLWLGYRLAPQNSANSNASFYGKIVKVHLANQGLTQTADPAVVNDGDFKKLGEVLP